MLVKHVQTFRYCWKMLDILILTAFYGTFLYETPCV